MNKNQTNRVYVDGCFDMLHYGHANALRQAHQFGDVLVVGVHSDEEIRLNKGPTLFDEKERFKMVSCLKWADEVIFQAPYDQLSVLDKYNCDFCAHGDDTTIDMNGRDAYYNLKKENKYKEYRRTPSISTTNIIQRILDLESKSNESIFPVDTLLIYQFQLASKVPLPSENIIYVPGSFDLLHIGHVMLLEKCFELGNNVVVGLYSDNDIKTMNGAKYPIMSLFERMLTVLSYKFVSNVIINAPLKVTETFMANFKIGKVVHGEMGYDDKMKSYLEIPKLKNKLQIIDSGSEVTFLDIIDRVKQNSAQYHQRNKLKESRENN